MGAMEKTKGTGAVSSFEPMTSGLCFLCDTVPVLRHRQPVVHSNLESKNDEDMVVLTDD